MGVTSCIRNHTYTSNSNDKRAQSFLLLSLVAIFSFSPHPHFPTLPFAAADFAHGNNSTNAPPPPPDPRAKQQTATLRPSIAVVVAVLTTIFSVTFLLLLYAKHCKRHGSGGGGGHISAATSAGRKLSGIDRAVIESLPVFRFGSLAGRQKEGLECAVCLNRFEEPEVLRLLPKCKHAFHVECVDTWLDAHSTCPLCRYRVDPEDVLLVLDPSHHHRPPSPDQSPDIPDVESGFFRRVSGRHSSAGERARSSSSRGVASFSLRSSLDGFGWRKKSGSSGGGEAAAGGCFDRYHRKDGMLLTREEEQEEAETGNNNSDNNSDGIVVVEVVGDGNIPGAGSPTGDVDKRTRLEHRINVVVSGGPHQQEERWSDVQPSDLLYLRSEMLMMMTSRRYSSSGSRADATTTAAGSGSSVINGRSVSEIAGLSRFRASRGGEGEEDRGIANGNRRRQRQRQAGLLSRWLGWVAPASGGDSRSMPDVRSAGTDQPSTPPAPTPPATAV